ncbi:MAG TPA: hypothetical protein PLI38_13455, partial [Flavobacterium sp.]|nr:hypothetical protein [Flavobacterium sp.]
VIGASHRLGNPVVSVSNIKYIAVWGLGDQEKSPQKYGSNLDLFRQKRQPKLSTKKPSRKLKHNFLNGQYFEKLLEIISKRKVDLD